MPIEFLYDFASPHSYVAFHKLREISSRLALEVNYSPIFLGGIFKATNDAPLSAGSPEYDYMAKRAPSIVDLKSLKRLVSQLLPGFKPCEEPDTV